MTLQEENSETAGDRRAVAWDPRHASLLHVVAAASSSNGLSVYQWYAHVGVAANEGSEELPTLLRLLSDYEAFNASDSVRSQSQQYRATLLECGGRLENKWSTAEPSQRDLLSRIVSVFRLAEIYVLPATAFHSDHYHSSNRAWLECPGIATADTVRFLRQYLLPPLLEGQPLLEEDDIMIEEEEDTQPRMIYPSDVEEKDLYWSLVLSLVRRGCLTQAWELLKRHSMYQAAREFLRSSSHALVEEERALSEAMWHNWEEIGRVLCTAPLPGGRSTECDDGTVSAHEREVYVNTEDMHLTHVHGMDVSYTDFVCWDIPSELRDEEDALTAAGDYPILFTPELAIQKFKLWRDFATHVRQTNRLCRQIPEIDHMFQVLCGDWTATKQPVPSFSSWAEQLCAELLYRTPDLRPRSIASRTLKLLRDFQEEGATESPIVSIMQGNAGRAMTQLNEFGGQSGAALPRTLMFLLFNLFVKAGVIPAESVAKELDFLIDAAHSIVSSLHASHPDMGPQLAIRLLLPYARKSRQVAAAMSLILEHYAPSSEQYGRTLLSLCSPMISEPLTSSSSSLQRDVTVLVLEGCVSVLIQLYRGEVSKYMNIESKIQLLLDGIGLEAIVLPKPWLGSCYRLLKVECYSVLLSLLQAMSFIVPVDGITDNDTAVSDAALMVKAKPMADTIQRYITTTRKRDGLELRPSDSIPYVAKLLIRVVTIFVLFRENSQPTERASHIVACLSDSTADAQTSPTVQLWLLRVARCLIDSHSTGVFDVNGMRTLLCRLSEVSSFLEYSKVVGTTSEEVDGMRKSFLDALVKACYVNSESVRDSLRAAKSHHAEDLVESYGKLGELDREAAKRCVRSMLL